MNTCELNPRHEACASLKSPLQTKDALATLRQIKNNADFTLRNGEESHQHQKNQ
jgi:hypothetical protein